ATVDYAINVATDTTFTGPQPVTLTIDASPNYNRVTPYQAAVMRVDDDARRPSPRPGDDCSCSGPNQAAENPAIGIARPAASADRVDLTDGLVAVAATDLSSGGGGGRGGGGRGGADGGGGGGGAPRGGAAGCRGGGGPPGARA